MGHLQTVGSERQRTQCLHLEAIQLASLHPQSVVIRRRAVVVAETRWSLRWSMNHQWSMVCCFTEQVANSVVWLFNG